MIVSATVHVASVCGTVMSKYSLISQKPESFTCESTSEPAPVAMTRSSGLVPGTSAELLVIATGAGSLVLSHVNDSGFWLIKEYFDMTVPQTLATWTVAETIIGVAGLALTLAAAAVR